MYPETGSLREVNKLSRGLGDSIKPSQQRAGDADPGVISEGESEDDFTVSHSKLHCAYVVKVVQFISESLLMVLHST